MNKLQPGDNPNIKSRNGPDVDHRPLRSSRVLAMSLLFLGGVLVSSLAACAPPATPGFDPAVNLVIDGSALDNYRFNAKRSQIELFSDGFPDEKLFLTIGDSDNIEKDPKTGKLVVPTRQHIFKEGPGESLVEIEDGIDGKVHEFGYAVGVDNNTSVVISVLEIENN